MKMVLPLPVNLANCRLHHMVKYRKKKAYWADLDMLLMVKRLPPPPETPWQAVHITFDWYVWNKMDPDGRDARKKWIIDWLRTRGYIIDDREENVDYTDLPQTVDRKSQRVELQILEAP